MTYEDFRDTIVSLLKLSLKEECTLRTKRILKNNDLELDGVILQKKGCTLSPTIYLNSFFDRYNEGMDLSDIVSEILSLFDQCADTGDVDFSFFTDFEKVRNRLFFKLIHRSRNEKLLKDVPFLPFLDLAVVFYYLFDEGKDSTSTILVRKEHLAVWGKTAEELFPIASDNAATYLPEEIVDMGEFLSGVIPDFTPQEEAKLYILSNRRHQYGASSLLSTRTLRSFAAKCGSSFYVLPSSIHEVLLMPSEHRDMDDSLSRMVRQINATEVPREDILSDHVYFYDAASQALS